MTKRILTGERIRLRPMKEKDIPFVNEMSFDPEILKWVVNSDPPDRKKTLRAGRKCLKNLVKKKPKSDKIFIIEIENSGLRKLIGYCGFSNIHEQNRSAAFSISITSTCWEKGYGKESTRVLFTHAFEEMHLHRIESYVMEFNTQSLKFHRKFGFIEEARFKEARFQNCRFWDKIIFRLLKSEWENLNKSQIEQSTWLIYNLRLSKETRIFYLKASEDELSDSTRH